MEFFPDKAFINNLCQPSDRMRGKKKGKLCGNFRQYYAEESEDYAEKTPVQIMRKFLKLNKVVPLAFSNI